VASFSLAELSLFVAKVADFCVSEVMFFPGTARFDDAKVGDF
jgi:hypothetical protein